MRLLQIQEFSLSTALEYRRPVAFGDAKLDSVAKALVSLLPAESVNPVEISLTRQNELFAYSLSVPLFNGAGSIVINAQGITVSFKQGRSTAHLDLMSKVTLTALETAKVEEVKRSVFSFTTHAVFAQPSDYSDHMQRFTELASDIDSGGLTLVSKIPELEGEMRYTSEKSLGYPNGLFIATNSSSTKNITIDLFKVLAAKFNAVAALEGISFNLA